MIKDNETIFGCVYNRICRRHERLDFPERGFAVGRIEPTVIERARRKPVEFECRRAIAKVG
ncbi:MAG: hypothetical protein ILO34_06220, partial [Kiritimatiellae bacterium]|nr:hypothetical protein [Kiritimatiellia bacterium]